VLTHAAQIDGVEQILLSVATTQTDAIALYSLLGFHTTGTELRALKIGDQYVDQLNMMWMPV
jgi:ribosomal protein S18 acetylase RimI-like enzyme